MKLTSGESVSAALVMMDSLSHKWSLAILPVLKMKIPGNILALALSNTLGPIITYCSPSKKLRQLLKLGSITMTVLVHDYATPNQQLTRVPSLNYYLMGLEPKLQENFASIIDVPTYLCTMIAIDEIINKVQYCAARRLHN
jgi:hypothetical protein